MVGCKSSPAAAVGDASMTEKIEKLRKRRNNRFRPPLPGQPPVQELADFKKCKTFKEKKDWIIAAAFIRGMCLSHRLDNQKIEDYLLPFAYLTQEEIQMMMGDLDQEA